MASVIDRMHWAVTASEYRPLVARRSSNCAVHNVSQRASEGVQFEMEKSLNLAASDQLHHDVELLFL